VIDEYLSLIDELGDEEAKEQYREEVGMVWESVEDHEDGQPDELPLTDDRLEDLIERAQDRVLEELARRRAA
jgi:hypothetical protein